MEPVSLTLGAIAAALVAKATDKATERAVEGGEGALARLVGWLRRRFSDDDQHDDAHTALTRLEEVPDSPSRLQALAGVIDGRAEADPGFRAELEALVKQAHAAGMDVGTIVQTAWGDQNVQIGGVQGSSITVTQQPPAR